MGKRQVAKGSDEIITFIAVQRRTGEWRETIGVVVFKDGPTGPFKDIGKPPVRNIDIAERTPWEEKTPPSGSKRTNGVEHRYLGWGNTRFFVCENGMRI